jgi:signal transduction histidine kinase/AraC-like DNA-binding protein/DNA-binding NarL/FixJ family response regulator/tetratricopeptide (TPR) repeat protein
MGERSHQRKDQPSGGFRALPPFALVLLILFGLLVANRTEAGAPPASAAVRKLLGAEPNNPAARRADAAQLLRQRAVWQADPLARLLVYRRLALDYHAMQLPDSSYRYWLRARREAGPLRAAYPLETSDVLAELGIHHFAALRLDSAGYYLQTASDQLVASGLDLHVNQPLPKADGQAEVPGRVAASHYANAGLAYRRRGELTAALRLYERALELQRATRDEPGLRWTQCLLGEAYEDQGDDARALLYYAKAAATSRTILQENETEATGQLTDVVEYAHDVLLAHGRTTQLNAWMTDGISRLRRFEARDSSINAFPTQQTILHLITATAALHNGQPTRAGQALAAADSTLQRLARLGTPARTYLELQLYWLGLHAQLAQVQRQPAAQAAYRARALRLLPTLTAPDVQARARTRLAEHLLTLGDGATAATVARPLVAAYRRQGARLFLRATYQLLRRAYAQQHQFDSAYAYAERYRYLSDTLRATDQYAALAAVETRYRTREQATRITHLTEQATRQRRKQTLIIGGVVALLLVLTGVAWAWRRTRQLNQRLAELDQLKDQFFANVSHELRTPLTLVVGPAEYLLTDPDRILPASVRQPLGLLLRNAQRLQQLVNQLLDFTKLEAGRMRPVPTPTRLDLLLAQLTDSFQPLASVRGLTLTYAAASLPPTLTVRLDADKVTHIVSNLLANALKFTPAGGQVRVTLSADEPGRWCITVADTGPGIAPDEQARVFERFYQSRQQQVSGGTGIGLALARELAELLGGTLTLASLPGAGSTFTLRLPAPLEVESGESDVDWGEEADDDAEVPEIAATDGVRRPRILIVEDNEDLRLFLRQLLAVHYDVVEAADGRAALALLATESIDLISSDEMMPGMSGTELLTALRGQPRPGPRIPFLLLTARADPQHRLLALELGVDDYLQKPFSPRELLARVFNLLTNYHERQRWLLAEAGEPTSPAFSDDEPVEPPAPVPGARGPHAPGVAVLEPPTRPLEGSLPLADQALLQRLREIAETHLSDASLDAAQLIKALGLSERTFYRKLKELTGLTPAAYLRDVRLARARQLLEDRAYQTVAEVAFAVGFEDAHYFSKVFLKHYGKRASEYLR